MFMSLLSVEGVGEEVILSAVAFVLALLVFGYYMMRNERREQTVHPEERENMNLLRESMRVEPRRRYGSQNQCPVCLNDIAYEVETNCGHIFCCKCWLAYRAHGSFLGAVRCPVCRQQVTILFQCFTENELNPTSGSEEEPELGTFIREINSYNRRYSGEPRQFWETVRELPILFRHLVSEIFSEGGFLYLYRLRVSLLVIGCVIYLLSPLDIIPEAAFGILGLVDDMLVLLVVSVFLTNVYRNYIADGGNIFGRHNQAPPVSSTSN